jgi:hypothetical protein
MFNVIKGQFPSLSQIDKTLPVGSDEVGIVDGTVLVVDASGAVPVFRAATDADATDPKAYPYFCKTAQDDFTAGMAGTIGQGATANEDGSAPYAVVTALAVGMSMEFETDQYKVGEGVDYPVGTLLTVADGGLLAPFTAGTANLVAEVTKALAQKWVNNAEAIVGRRTGANVDVLTARTMWVPNLVLS